jgi:hypothetical protein
LPRLQPQGQRAPFGWLGITYEVPASAKIVKVQFSTDWGIGETGEWIIG